METTISIKKLLNDNTHKFEDGEVLYNSCKFELLQGNIVKIDLEEINGLSSSFLNGFLMPLIDDYGKDTLKERVSFSNMKKGHQMVIKRYLHSVFLEKND